MFFTHKVRQKELLKLESVKVKRSCRRTNYNLKLNYELNSGIELCGVSIKIWKNSLSLGVLFYVSKKGINYIWESSQKNGLDHIGYNMYYLII